MSGASELAHLPAVRSLVDGFKFHYDWLKRRGQRYMPEDVDEWLDEELNRRADIALSLHKPQDLSIKDEVIEYVKPRLKLWINQGGGPLPDTEKFPGM